MTQSSNDAAEKPQPQEESPKQEAKRISEARRLRAAILYEVIRVEGEGELARTWRALWWSGLAAGLSIGFSVLSQALLAANLPDVGWNTIIEKMGYSVGFIIVILGRQQLFTENTLTAVLPVITAWKLYWLWIMLRLWAIVLVANLVGAFIFALAIAYLGMLPPDVSAEVAAISEHMMENSPAEMFVKGIAAGWLIAALVWMLPSAENVEIFLIGLMTYLIALGGFTHVIAGSVEAFYLWVTQAATTLDVFLKFLLPALAGNVVGGTILFGLLSYAQVRDEIT
ncbi:formate/nitrite transporter family protein [Dichotomicrobium thermohalophilum]|uniref:Formate/nitrite transporter FocA (FNT family) n=1 Tax=Dichotomicrobium thermohalophilum TaxID=933063 RepID=A0A397Q3S3_9HYPH|nr:formate/nitrite transporter family protein [Dichotomicrobium thermohalophilum]RIA55059.1 formate/nitrite transporter FocA (FNT family) [Dichotomicrobium thermohalophilum]